jgi:hypothetical protein
MWMADLFCYRGGTKSEVELEQTHYLLFILTFRFLNSGIVFRQVV